MLDLTGRIDRVKTYIPDTGFTIFRLRTETEEYDVICTMPYALNEQQTVHVTGHLHAHPKYGTQIRARDVSPEDPSTEEGILAYLSSGVISGIGPSLAARIVASFRAATIHVLDHEPGRLLEVSGVGRKKLVRITESWRSKRDGARTVAELCRLGLSPAYAFRVYRQYHGNSLAVLKDNPYRLAEEVHGIGFRKADAIAHAIGFQGDHRFRVKAGILYCLREGLAAGNSYLPQQALVAQAASLLGINEDIIPPLLINLVLEHALMIRSPAGAVEDRSGRPPARYCYLITAFRAERAIERRLAAMGKLLPKNIAADYHPQLTDEQRSAVQASLAAGITVITGSAGSGKTTTLRAIIAGLEKHRISYWLCAPTGRAAKRITEVTGRDATTIHRMLGIGGSAAARRSARNPIPAEYVICDECSMIDLALFRDMVEAIGWNGRLVLIGDPNQLPPVGPGAPFRDVIESGRFPVIRLTRVHRQKERSGIIEVADAIRTGTCPQPPNQNDAYWFKISDPERIASTVVSLVTERIPATFSIPFEEIQVIAPMRKGGVGIDALNQRIRQAVQPPGKPAFGPFLLDDRVMQIENDYERGVFNGELGRITRIESAKQRVMVDFEGIQDTVEYAPADLHKLALAYCISVHRFQGSQQRAIVLPLHPMHATMIRRRDLMYTAVTRASHLLVLVGTGDALALSAQSSLIEQRYSSLFRELV